MLEIRTDILNHSIFVRLLATLNYNRPFLDLIANEKLLKIVDRLFRLILASASDRTLSKRMNSTSLFPLIQP